MPLRSSERFPAVLFRVGEIACALALFDVKEILPLPRLAVPPSAPPALAGLVSVGGMPLAVLRPEVLFGLPEPADEPDLYSHLIVLRGSRAVALLVSRADDVIVVSRSGVSAVGDQETLRGCVTGVFGHGGREVMLVSGTRLLGIQERDRIADYARREAERVLSLGQA